MMTNLPEDSYDVVVIGGGAAGRGADAGQRAADGAGLVPAEHPPGAGEHIPTDPAGRTAVPGVWAAGNVTDLSAQVGTAAAAGTFAAAQINADLVAEETRQALAAVPVRG